MELKKERNLIYSILPKFFVCIILFLSLCNIVSAQTKSVAVSSTSTRGISTSVTLNTSSFVLDYPELQFSITTTVQGIRYTNEPCPICGGSDHIETGVNGFGIYLVDANNSSNYVLIANKTYNKISGTWTETNHNGDFFGTGVYKANVSSLIGKTVYISSNVYFGHDGHDNVMYGSFTLNSVYQNSYFPVIITNPSNVAINFNEVANFSILANYVTSYQWYKNSIEIIGATSNTLSFTANDYNDTGSNYYCKVTSPDGTLNSTSASLTIYDNVFPTMSLIKSIESTTDELTVIVDADDVGSGLAVNAYSINGVTYQQSNIFRITENGTYTFYVRDKANNVSSSSLTIGNIQTLADSGLKKYYIMEDGNLVDSKAKLSGTVADLEISFKGNGATGGEIVVDKENNVVSAIMIIGKYTITYDGKKYTIDSSRPVVTVNNNTMTASNDNGVSYYQVTTENEEPLDWINVDSTEELEVDLRILNLSAGDYYIWAKSSTGVVSYPYEITIE